MKNAAAETTASVGASPRVVNSVRIVVAVAINPRSGWTTMPFTTDDNAAADDDEPVDGSS
jgi:hypothetical protein